MVIEANVTPDAHAISNIAAVKTRDSSARVPHKPVGPLLRMKFARSLVKRVPRAHYDR